MKGAIVVCFLALSAVTLARPKETTYTDKYDKINIDEILQNKRILNNHINCILDKGACTAEGKELKSHITDALQNDCAKCTAVQRQRSEQVIEHLYRKEKDSWELLKAKYDPTGAYYKSHESQFKDKN